MSQIFYISIANTTSDEFDKISKRTQAFLNVEFSIADLGDDIVYRQLVYWFNENLLISDPKVYKLKKIDFMDYCWIRCVHIMRLYGMNVRSVLEIKEALFKRIDYYAILEQTGGLSKILDGLTTEQKEEALKLINENRNFYPHEAARSSVFFAILLECFQFRQPLSLLIAPNNDVVVLNEKEPTRSLIHDKAKAIYHGSHLKIALDQICWKYLGENILDLRNKYFGLLSESELKIIDAIRQKGVNEVSIKFNSNSEPERIEVTTVNKVQASARLTEILKTNAYQEIKIKTQAGIIASFENTTKTKLGNNGTS